MTTSAHRGAGVALAGLALALLVGCESGLQQQEGTYRYRLERLDALAATAPAPLRAAVAARRQELVAAYDALPRDEGPRGEGLGTLCQGLNAALEEFAAKAQDAAAEAASRDSAAAAAAATRDAASAAAEGARLRAQLVGHWTGGGIDLTVTADGHVAYRRSGGVVTKSLEGSLARCSSTGFDVSVLGLTTTFAVQAWPHEVAGAWTMRLDDTDVTRTPSP